MTAGLVFPGSRTLAQWWRQLHPPEGTLLWIGHLFIHRFEALVEISRPRKLEPLALAVLRALLLEHSQNGAAPDMLARLERRLRVGRPLLYQVLKHLQQSGVAAEVPDWLPTASAALAVQQGAYAESTQERRVFHFAQADEATAGPPEYLPLLGGVALPWTPSATWAFALEHWQRCLHADAAWKQRSHFPSDVRALPTNGVFEGLAQWQRIPVAQAEHHLAALLRRDAEPLQGYAIRPDGWRLESGVPILSLAEPPSGVFAAVLQPPSAGDCALAWQQWCQPRGVPPAEVAQCQLELQAERLQVTVPPSLLERLRAARSDALKGEAWVLIGEGAIRRAARLELQAVESRTLS